MKPKALTLYKVALKAGFSLSGLYLLTTFLHFMLLYLYSFITARFNLGKNFFNKKLFKKLLFFNKCDARGGIQNVNLFRQFF
jgi:hypothetical protein